jgi:hypothetical protein
LKAGAATRLCGVAGLRAIAEDDGMLDSPFGYCAVCRAYVLLDLTRRQCAREHCCTAATKCPFERCFTGVEYRAPPRPAKPRRPRR